ncbi:peptidoglycan-binding protein [Paracoccaceae bacterium Fryx2]|nr:peptidoglycan-binding protein [Paracoccaceae bacterium Fryx2]
MRAIGWRLTGTAGMLALLATMAAAEDRALVIGNRNYDDAADIAEADAALKAVPALQAAGFTVTSGADLPSAAMRDLLSALLAGLKPGDRLVIVLSGHFAQSSGQAFFLGTESSLPDLATVAAVSLPLASVLEVAAMAPGGAVVLLGTETRRLPLGPGLDPGPGAPPVPQGVTLVQGDAGRIAGFATRALGQRGVPMASLLDGSPALTADGYLSPLTPFRPADAASPPVAPPPVAPALNAEDAFWQATRAINTVDAYAAYLTRYPQGAHAAEARAESARIRAEPGRQARLAEDALALTRDQRRTIQRALALLEFDPKGIDGLFGAGSRTAIAGWQTRNGVPASGFLTRDQIVQLTAQADRRAAELEAAAAARRAEQEREDRLFWDQTGAAGDEAGLRAYLKRFPDGLFADLATSRLTAIEDARRQQAAAQDRAAWDRATAGNTIAGYRDYLAAFPKGAFAAEAQARIDTLTDEAEAGPDRARYEATEAALGLNDLARSLIERRLDALNLNPGPVDGVFDNQTRRAIRRFQRERGADATGYLDQVTTVALLSGVLPGN